MSEYADVSDQATDQEMAFRSAALAAACAHKKPPLDFDGVHCTEGDEEIPAERLALGYWTCVGCQSMIELLKKQGRR